MSTYIGPDRRRHCVLVTGNSEYHMRGRRCVAVRRSDGRWLDGHIAEGAELVALLEPNGAFRSAEETLPGVGARLMFNTDVVTSPVCDVHRPTVTAVHHYPIAA